MIKTPIRKIIAIYCFFLLFFLQVLVSGGASDNLTGKQIMERAGDLSGLGLKTAVAKVKMVLVDSTGGRRERIFILRSKVDGGLRKMIMKFLSPADVAGTGLLVIEREKGAQDQFLYLPETGKVRKISGSGLHSSFIGSDFLYWDLRHHAADEAEHERLSDEVISGVSCRVVKSVFLKESNAPYGSIVSWVSISNDMVVKIEFYDLSGRKVKKLVNSKIEKKEGRWVVMESKMTDLKNNHSTNLQVLEVNFLKDIPDGEFTKTALQSVE